MFMLLFDVILLFKAFWFIFMNVYTDDEIFFLMDVFPQDTQGHFKSKWVTVYFMKKKMWSHHLRWTQQYHILGSER